MAVYKCAGRKRNDEAGKTLCTYESETPWRRSPCPGCGGWYNCDKVGADKKDATEGTLAAALTLPPPPRISTSIPEFDEVLGGGIVKPSTIVLTGPPGIGKSTLLLQTANGVAQGNRRVLYASGEESQDAVLLLAARLGIANAYVRVLGNQGDAYQITAEAESYKPALLIVDSINTTVCEDVDADVGSAHQLKAVSNWLTSFALSEKVCVLIVCHVNKDNELAGPRTLEHLVDGVVYFESGEEFDEDESPIPGTENVRVLTSSSKMRHGPSSVSAYLELTEKGLQPFADRRRRRGALVVP